MNRYKYWLIWFYCIWLVLSIVSVNSSPVDAKAKTISVQAQAEPINCLSVTDGRVCMQYFQEITPTPTVVPIVSTPIEQVDEYVWDLMEHAGTPVLGSVSGGSWAFPGAALTASTYRIYGDYLTGRTVLRADWVVAWNPNTGPNPTGVRLVKMDNGPANITELARVDAMNRTTPQVSGVDITAEIQTILDNGEYKHLGHQTYGNGANGCLIYSSVIYIILR